jgi:hypothetical protein
VNIDEVVVRSISTAGGRSEAPLGGESRDCLASILGTRHRPDAVELHFNMSFEAFGKSVLCRQFRLAAGSSSSSHPSALGTLPGRSLAARQSHSRLNGSSGGGTRSGRCTLLLLAIVAEQTQFTRLLRIRAVDFLRRAIENCPISVFTSKSSAGRLCLLQEPSSFASFKRPYSTARYGMKTLDALPGSIRAATLTLLDA